MASATEHKHTNRLINESKARYAQRDDVSKVAPGRFIESASADRVFFVEGVDLQGGRVRSVFVSHRSQGREGVIVASQGVIENHPSGERFLVLERGRRYEGVPGQAEYRMLEFERYAIRLDTRPEAPLAELQARAKPTRQLWREPTPYHQAELLWRLGLPIIAVLLALLAIPLAYTNPRAGRSLNLIVAVIVILQYHNSQSTVQAWVQQGRLSFHTGVWLAHAVVLTLVVLLFVRRVYMQRWLPQWARPSYWRQRRSGRGSDRMPPPGGGTSGGTSSDTSDGTSGVTRGGARAVAEAQAG